MTVHPSLSPMKSQWKAEHRFLSQWKWKIERRLKEIEDMQASFFGEGGNG